MKKTFTIPGWLLAIIVTIAVLAILWAIGVFDSHEVKKTETERDNLEKVIDTATIKRDSTLSGMSEDSNRSTDTANQLIKNLPDEKYNIIRDTSDDYMWRKITE